MRYCKIQEYIRLDRAFDARRFIAIQSNQLDQKHATTRPFNAADFLHDDADIIDYIAELTSDNDPVPIASALGDVARARNLSQLARDVGLSRVGLTKALSPGGNPSFATIAKVASALGSKIAFKAKPQG